MLDQILIDAPCQQIPVSGNPFLHRAGGPSRGGGVRAAGQGARARRRTWSIGRANQATFQVKFLDDFLTIMSQNNQQTTSANDALVDLSIIRLTYIKGDTFNSIVNIAPHQPRITPPHCSAYVYNTSPISAQGSSLRGGSPAEVSTDRVFYHVPRQLYDNPSCGFHSPPRQHL